MSTEDTQGHTGADSAAGPSVHDFLSSTAHLTNEQRMLAALEALVASSQRTELLLTELVTLSKPKALSGPGGVDYPKSVPQMINKARGK